MNPQVPEEELSKLRGDKRSVARVVEGDEAEDDEEDLEDAHEDLDLEPGKIGVIITNENPKRGGKPKLVHRLIYPSFDDDTIKVNAHARQFLLHFGFGSANASFKNGTLRMAIRGLAFFF